MIVIIMKKIRVKIGLIIFLLENNQQEIMQLKFNIYCNN